MPSRTLIYTIMQYSKEVKVSATVSATLYCSKTETTARRLYFNKMKEIHKDFSVEEIGLFINSNFLI